MWSRDDDGGGESEPKWDASYGALVFGRADGGALMVVDSGAVGGVCAEVVPCVVVGCGQHATSHQCGC